MHRGTKYRHGYLLIEGAEKGRGSRNVLVDGLAALGRVWAKGYLPEDLKLHYLLTWFTYSRGRVLLQARKTGFHRNTLLLHFKSLGRFKKTMRMRVLWEGICKSSPRKDYFGKQVLFLKRIKVDPRVTDMDSRRLSRLWILGFPLRVLSSHFVLWGFRRGWTREEIAGKLGISMRTLHRLRVYSSKIGSPAGKWLKDQRASKKDWFPRWKKTGRKRRTTSR